MIFIADKLPIGIWRPALVNVNLGPVLQPLHAEIHRIPAFLGRIGVDSIGAEVCNGFWLCCICCQPPALQLRLYQLGRLIVPETKLINLIEDVDFFFPGIIVQFHIGQRIQRKAKIKSVINVVKFCHHSIAHPHIFHVLKNRPTGAGDFPQVFMAVSHLILGLELLGLDDELLSQPFLRCVQIGSVAYQPVRILDDLLLVHPVVL